MTTRTAEIDLEDEPYVPAPLAQVIAWSEVRPFRSPGNGFKYQHGPKWLKCHGKAGCVGYVIDPVGKHRLPFRGYCLGWYDCRKSELASAVMLRRTRLDPLFDRIEHAQSAAQAHLDGLHAKASKS
jgi:hypothetical protein